MQTAIGLLIPFAGTTLGAATVFLLRGEMSRRTQRIFSGFAAGVMVAASIWSLLIPAMDQSADMGRFAFAPAAVGFALGIAFLLLIDEVVPHLHPASNEEEGMRSGLSDTAKLFLAVTIHNVPEGMAVGVVFAGIAGGASRVSVGAAMALALGIAIQNFPEGAIISMPLRSHGMSKGQAFAFGAISGAVEPVAAAVTIALANVMVPVLPYLLGFAAGAMMYVVVEELVPEMSRGEHSNVGVIAFSAGFLLMMVLDVALG